MSHQFVNFKDVLLIENLYHDLLLIIISVSSQLIIQLQPKANFNFSYGRIRY